MKSNEDDYKVLIYFNQNSEKCELKPSVEQLKIITSDLNEDQKIIACAGSGKTTTLVIRLKYLIDKGIDPKRILVTTFNIDAGLNIRTRSRQLIGPQSNSIEIGNIDKIAYKFYQQYILQSQFCVNKYKLSIKEYCYELYKYLKTQEGKDNILNKYSYFFFDEFQDSSELQYDILMLFKQNGCFVTVIGDDAQNIYSWRDSKICLIQNQIDEDILKYTNRNIITYSLSTNYRSSKAITLFSNQIVENSEYLIQKRMQYIERHNQNLNWQPHLRYYKNVSDQISSIFRDIKQLQGMYKLRDIAILSATKKPLTFFQEYIEKKNYQNQKNEDKIIPYVFQYDQHAAFYKKYNQQQDKQDKLTLSTLHRAKGLEWKVVFFIGLNDYYFPGTFLRDSDGIMRLEECRRLFYVGCTRASDLLYFAVTKQSEEKKLTEKMVCRFFQSIERDLLKVDDQIQNSDFATEEEEIVPIATEKETKVTKIIDLFDHIDFDQSEKFMKDLPIYKNENIHNQILLDVKFIDENYLYIDLGLFIDVLIQRTVAEEFQDFEGYQYTHANEVLFSLFWEEAEYQVIEQYQLFFRSFKGYQLIDSSDQFIEQLKIFYKDDESKQINLMKESSLSKIYNKIQEFSQKYQIPFQQIIIHNYLFLKSQLKHGKNRKSAQGRTQEYFPEDFDRKPYIEAYKNFVDKSKKTNHIRQDIYEISKCGQLVDLMRRSLYRDDFEKLCPNQLIVNVLQFVMQLKTKNYQKVKVKPVFGNEDLNGELDFIADDTIYEIKASQNLEVSKENILQGLAYKALCTQNGHKINNIVFYNPLCGKIQTFDVSKWDHSEELIKFLKDKSIEKHQKDQQEGLKQLEIHQKYADKLAQKRLLLPQSQETESQIGNNNYLGSKKIESKNKIVQQQQYQNRDQKFTKSVVHAQQNKLHNKFNPPASNPQKQPITDMKSFIQQKQQQKKEEACLDKNLNNNLFQLPQPLFNQIQRFDSQKSQSSNNQYNNTSIESTTLFSKDNFQDEDFVEDESSDDDSSEDEQYSKQGDNTQKINNLFKISPQFNAEVSYTSFRKTQSNESFNFIQNQDSSQSKPFQMRNQTFPNTDRIEIKPIFSNQSSYQQKSQSCSKMFTPQKAAIQPQKYNEKISYSDTKHNNLKRSHSSFVNQSKINQQNKPFDDEEEEDISEIEDFNTPLKKIKRLEENQSASKQSSQKLDQSILKLINDIESDSENESS